MSRARHIPYAYSKRAPGVVLTYASVSRKLSPVALQDLGPGKVPRPYPKGPICSATYISIRATCPDSCAFKDNGCYAQHGVNRRIMKTLDEQAVAKTIADEEFFLVRDAFPKSSTIPQDGARGGRDLRLHVGGDVQGTGHALALSQAARHWKNRSGGAVWTYTHRWRDIQIVAWQDISVLASCESASDVAAAHSLGYRAAIVVDKFKSERLYIEQGVKILPCPYETRGKTCVECRLCLDAPIKPNIVIGFQVHGHGKESAKRRLKVVP